MKLMRLPETLAKTGLSRTRLYEAVAAGTFPKPVKLGPDARAIGFVESEVDTWIEARIAERETAALPEQSGRGSSIATAAAP